MKTTDVTGKVGRRPKAGTERSGVTKIGKLLMVIQPGGSLTPIAATVTSGN